MLFPLEPKGFKKKATVTGFLAGLAATEAAAEGLKVYGRNRGANFLNAGIELGQKGERMNPFTESMSRNLLGNRQVLPYEAGLEIGGRMKNMEPERSERFLNKVIGMGAARKQSMEEVGQKVKDPVLNAIDQYQIGQDRAAPLFQSTIMKGSKPQESNALAGKIVANTASVPLGLVDFRAAARPALRTAERHPVGQKVQKQLFPEGTKREKTYNAVRNYID